MIAIVLVGGQGTRLRPLTLDRPKAMMPIAGRPFLAHMLDRLAAAGVSHVAFSCGYLPDPIRDAFGDGHAGMRVSYAVEAEPLDTAGAIRFAAHPLVTDAPFLALNGDVLASADLADLIDLHRASSARATLTLTRVADPRRYGLVLTEGDGAVTAFLEKPGPEASLPEGEPFWINAGCYLLDPSVLDLIAPDVRVNIEREVFPRLVGGGLYGWRSGGYWNDIGTPASYIAANVAALAGVLGDAPRDFVLGPGCELGDGARLEGGTAAGAGVRIGTGAVVRGSVLDDGVSVGDGAVVIASAVGRGAVIGAGARVVGGSVVGAGVRVPSGATVDGDLLYPDPADGS